MKGIKNNTYEEKKRIPTTTIAIFEEIAEIKTAFKNAEKIKAGKLKGRPAEELLNEL